jgi:hypothetical protein
MTHEILLEEPVGHDVIQRSEDDAAVSHTIPSHMVLARREDSDTGVAFHVERDLQPNRVVGTAYEAPIILVAGNSGIRRIALIRLTHAKIPYSASMCG